MLPFNSILKKNNSNSRNESVSTHTIEMFCKILDYDIGGIMDCIADENKN